MTLINNESTQGFSSLEKELVHHLEAAASCVTVFAVG